MLKENNLNLKRQEDIIFLKYILMIDLLIFKNNNNIDMRI